MLPFRKRSNGGGTSHCEAEAEEAPMWGACRHRCCNRCSALTASQTPSLSLFPALCLSASHSHFCVTLICRTEPTQNAALTSCSQLWNPAIHLLSVPLRLFTYHWVPFFFVFLTTPPEENLFTHSYLQCVIWWGLCCNPCLRLMFCPCIVATCVPLTVQITCKCSISCSFSCGGSYRAFSWAGAITHWHKDQQSIDKSRTIGCFETHVLRCFLITEQWCSYRLCCEEWSENEHIVLSVLAL